MSDKAEKIVIGLGGSDNIIEIEACITRLRVEVDDPNAVDEVQLKGAGAIAVMQAGSVVQVIVGPEADVLAQTIQDDL